MKTSLGTKLNAAGRAPLPRVHSPSPLLCSSLLPRRWILPIPTEPTAPRTLLRLSRITRGCRRHGSTTAPGPRGPPTPPSPPACTGAHHQLPPGATRMVPPRAPLYGGSRFPATPCHRRRECPSRSIPMETAAQGSPLRRSPEPRRTRGLLTLSMGCRHVTRGPPLQCMGTRSWPIHTHPGPAVEQLPTPPRGTQRTLLTTNLSTVQTITTTTLTAITSTVGQ